MCIIRSPPAAYSMTKHTCSCVWKHANRLTRNGWRTLLTVSKILFSHIRLWKGGEPRQTCARSFTDKEATYKKTNKKQLYVYLSTSSRATMSPFFRALIANISPVLLYSANNTWGEKRHFSFLPALFWTTRAETIRQIRFLKWLIWLTFPGCSLWNIRILCLCWSHKRNNLKMSPSTFNEHFLTTLLHLKTKQSLTAGW